MMHNTVKEVRTRYEEIKHGLWRHDYTGVYGKTRYYIYNGEKIRKEKAEEILDNLKKEEKERKAMKGKTKDI